MAVPFAALQEANPGAVIELFELQLNATQHGVDETYRFHAGANANEPGFLLLEDGDDLLLEDGSKFKLDQLDYFDVAWAGNAYTRFPLEAEGFEYSGTGQLPRPTLRVSNLLGTITGLILSLPRGIEGAKVTRIRTLLRYLDAVNFPGDVSPYSPDPTAEFPREVYYVDRKAKETRDFIELELAAVFDLVNVRAPKRQCSNFCPWEYRGAECNYAGNAYFDENDESVLTLAEDKCGKRLSSCALRFGQLTGKGTVTLGSNLLVLDDALSIDTGAPVKGFGVPAGTTVVSVSGNVVTMSANATASSSASATATLANTTRDRLSTSPSPASQGIAKGMIVSGSSFGASVIASGTTVESVDATYIVLSQPVPWELVATLSATRTATLFSDETSYSRQNSGQLDAGKDLVITGDLTGIAVGQFVTGPGLPASANVKITRLFSEGGFSRYETSESSFVTLSYSGLLADSTGSYKFYTVGAQSPVAYSFVAPDRTYTFRSEGVLNFGGFPGIGSYYA